MGIQTYIAQWGNNLAVRIPEPLVEQWGIRAGTVIEITHDGDHLMLSKKVYDLSDMLSQVTADNLHPELTTGPA